MKKKILLILALVVVLLFAGSFFDAYVFPDSEYRQDTLNKAEESMEVTFNSNVNSEVKSFSLSELSAHNSASSCWSNIFGNVYDLTSYVDKHPGGREQILAICGKNGNDLFNSQHGGNVKIENLLKNFYIGVYTQ